MQDARRWVVDTCHDIGRSELAECAELGVSELVTNALLHAAPPIQVRVRGTREHPRVEVRDGSRDRPMLPTTDQDEDNDLLLTFGRGLSIVARCSDAWGAEIEVDGKTVWFAPARSFAEDDGVLGLITGDEDPPAVSPEDPVGVQIRGVPVDLYLAFQRHFRELRREVRLLALAHESDYPLAKDLSELFASLERQLREGIGLDQLENAAASGVSETEVDMITSRASTRTMERFIEMLDLADEFCRQQRLLSLARTEEQRDFQQWYLGEFVRQGRGEPPLSWADAATSSSRQSTAS
ncbi:ATP-binding protein [Nocardioides sp. W7]|uniref:ATP-binding protein n=1 Tax=Nocardioides sp. W7 TaxID=2931390 RepID=UPI001FD1D3DF|nr:ATP-binding protein [Nocardioides sp. W7]